MAVKCGKASAQGKHTAHLQPCLSLATIKINKYDNNELDKNKFDRRKVAKNYGMAN